MKRNGYVTSNAKTSHQGCEPVRALRLPTNHGAEPLRRLVSEPQASREDLATRGPESACKTAETRTSVAERVVVRPTTTRARGPRVELRLRERMDARGAHRNRVIPPRLQALQAAQLAGDRPPVPLAVQPAQHRARPCRGTAAARGERTNGLMADCGVARQSKHLAIRKRLERTPCPQQIAGTTRSPRTVCRPLCRP